jgi:hypothetical protein
LEDAGDLLGQRAFLAPNAEEGSETLADAVRRRAAQDALAGGVREEHPPGGVHREDEVGRLFYELPEQAVRLGDGRR